MLSIPLRQALFDIPSGKGPEPLEWMNQGNCIEYPDYTELETWLQLLVCRDCPVVDQCRAYGVETPPTPSDVLRGVVYGGLSPEDLYALRKQLDPKE